MHCVSLGQHWRPVSSLPPCTRNWSLSRFDPTKSSTSPARQSKSTRRLPTPTAQRQRPRSDRSDPRSGHDDSLGSKSVTVDPGKSQIVTLTAKAEPWLGIETRATLKRNGKTLATQSDYCTCAKYCAGAHRRLRHPDGGKCSRRQTRRDHQVAHACVAGCRVRQLRRVLRGRRAITTISHRTSIATGRGRRATTNRPRI